VLQRADAARMVTAAVAGDPSFTTTPVTLLAVGKAAASMATAFHAAVSGRIASGLAIGTHAAEPLPAPLTWLVSSHPVPDVRSVEAGRAALSLATAVDPGARLVVLLSGGASALMAVPADGLTLGDKQHVTRRLLAADADIHALNRVRKHLSAIKGGQLAARCRGAVTTLAVSDVVGDDPSVIGSGPTEPDPSTFADALAVIDRAGGRSAYPPRAIARLERGAAGLVPETPKPGDPVFARSTLHVIGSRRHAMEGAASAARIEGFHAIVCDEPVVGEARVAARAWVARVAAIAREDERPLAIVSSGETTVQVVGTGKGGRNQEFALAAAGGLAAIGRPALLISLGTDGVDGPTDAAAPLPATDTTARARARGLDPMRYLDANDAWSFFSALGDLVRTGPTGTNVGDVQVALVAPAPAMHRPAEAGGG
jgi:glycerate 2-kinase